MPNDLPVRSVLDESTWYKIGVNRAINSPNYSYYTLNNYNASALQTHTFLSIHLSPKRFLSLSRALYALFLCYRTEEDRIEINSKKLINLLSGAHLLFCIYNYTCKWKNNLKIFLSREGVWRFEILHYATWTTEEKLWFYELWSHSFLCDYCTNRSSINERNNRPQFWYV